MNARALAPILAVTLVACAPAALKPADGVLSTTLPPVTPTLASGSTTPDSADIPTVPAVMPTPSAPAQVCDQLSLNASPGLYVVSVVPVPELVWDRTPRQFVVDVCNTSPDATPIGSRFVVLIYFPGEASPRGQTSELPVRLEPGLHGLTLEWWTPGLQNHISACNIQPPVQVAVAYTYPPSLNILHPIPFGDGQDRWTFAVKCGGHFP